jgi:hypothetical protein
MPSVLQVAWFVHLHLDTADEDGPHPHGGSTRYYRMAGKPRPMLVIAAPKKREHDRRWFVVLRTTTKRPDDVGVGRSRWQCIGNCLQEAKESFLCFEPALIPENLLHIVNDQSPILVPYHELAFRSLLTIVRHWAMNAKIAAVFGVAFEMHNASEQP